jgi:hypothetical protein
MSSEHLEDWVWQGQFGWLLGWMLAGKELVNLLVKRLFLQSVPVSVLPQLRLRKRGTQTRNASEHVLQLDLNVYHCSSYTTSSV